MRSISSRSSPTRSLNQPFSFLFMNCLTLCAIGVLPGTSWTADGPYTRPVRAQTTVAAGFGYQDDESSSITVKTYDAQSGEVLSADTYELDIKDDGPSTSHPRTRIFAGGVGVGAGSLSEFTLRVYDAANGRFLWEGRLNLTVGDHPEGVTQQVVAHIQPRARIMRIANSSNAAGQPYFVLRARHPETGQLMWSDEFSPDAATARIEHISRSVIGVTGAAPRDVDFRIKMPDQAGRRLLWEDQVAPTEESEQSVPEQSDETVGATPSETQSASPSAALPVDVPSNGIETDRKTAIVERESPPAGSAFS